ncbi:Dibenzothiophene desulfurization enzyme C [Methylobacterium crusticola]|uniref:Dibenzothiophene monooxygenase n=1 Tax=Methylobacterium crusticola TaxID=1697972 RepID=A0ABQ4QVT4_9HYPH|nr:acyl-CoA dehydrogenase family protein [Methylobacterium crusticola]GJD49456.1 Dibenzothiophene desulfurization enzyme C [Methylobacterium crusticola]
MATIETNDGAVRDGAPDWSALAQGVADDLRADANTRERLAARPVRELALLRESKLLTLLDAREYGGGGGSFAQALAAVRIVARADTAIAQLLSYHYLHRTNALWRAGPAQREGLALASARDRWFWGGASNPRDPESVLVPDGDDFRLNGRKTFASNAAVADRITLRAELGGGFAVIVIPGDRPGVTHGNDWDAFGQRLTESGSIAFENVRVARDEILGEALPPAAPALSPLTTLVVPLHQMLIAGFYVGTAEGALTEAAEYIRTQARPWQASGVAAAREDPYILEHIGNLDVEVRASAALTAAAGEAFEAAVAQGEGLTPTRRTEVAAAIYAAKVHASRTALQVTSQIFELMGARATSSRYGFDRFWRNIRTHTLHDPVVYKAREVGNFALNGTITPTPLYT